MILRSLNYITARIYSHSHVEKNNEDEAFSKRQLNWDANSKLTVERVSLIEA